MSQNLGSPLVTLRRPPPPFTCDVIYGWPLINLSIGWNLELFGIQSDCQFVYLRSTDNEIRSSKYWTQRAVGGYKGLGLYQPATESAVTSPRLPKRGMLIQRHSDVMRRCHVIPTLPSTRGVRPQPVNTRVILHVKTPS